MPEGSYRGFPLARSDDLVTEEIGAEIVVYDGLSKEAHCLGPLAATVFAASDGRTSVADLAGITSASLGEPVDVARVEQALAELESRDLLVAPADGDGISRRQMFRRTAVLGGAAMAAPLVTSILTPAYTSAATPMPPGETPLSHVLACFQCGTMTYRMKWEWDDEDNQVRECGNLNSECLPGLSCNPPTEGGCLDPTTMQENPNGSVTFTFPANCQLTDYAFKGNCDEGSCVNPTANETDAVPPLPAPGPSYTTEATCTN